MTSFRTQVRADDPSNIRALVTACGNFSAEEIAIAGDLAAETLQKGAAAGYGFVFAEADGRLLGYACYGDIPGTEKRFDLYWIAVDPAARRQGLAAALMARAEAAVREEGGAHLFIDTSTRPDYAAARAFYLRMGYALVAEIADFYRDGDGKAVFGKRL